MSIWTTSLSCVPHSPTAGEHGYELIVWVAFISGQSNQLDAKAAELGVFLAPRCHSTVATRDRVPRAKGVPLSRPSSPPGDCSTFTLPPLTQCIESVWLHSAQRICMRQLYPDVLLGVSVSRFRTIASRVWIPPQRIGSFVVFAPCEAHRARTVRLFPQKAPETATRGRIRRLECLVNIAHAEMPTWKYTAGSTLGSGHLPRGMLVPSPAPRPLG